EVLAEWRAQAHSTTSPRVLEGLVIVPLRDAIEQIEAGREVPIQEPRLREAQINLQTLQRAAELQAQELALAHEVALSEADIADNAFLGRVAGAERDLTRRL